MSESEEASKTRSVILGAVIGLGLLIGLVIKRLGEILELLEGAK